MRIYVKNELKGITAEYAAVELARFLPLVNGIEAVENAQDAEMVFELSTDGRMADYSYSIKGDGRTVRLLGKTENEVLLAVYLALERMGVFFDTEGSHTAITGTDITAVKNIDVTVRPVVRLRGIRQHINFPMDISSYRIEDAKEYIRDLARMRMNAITFHSYNGMWHDNPGHFFYGKTFPIPEHKAIRPLVEGDRIFVSPECEKHLGDESAVAEFAKDFLRQLIDTAKEAGMRVTLSLEPTDNVKMFADALSYYPNIDELEIITPEYGVFADAEESYSQVLDRAVELFGDRILDEKGRLPGLDPDGVVPPKIWDTMRSLSEAIYLYEHRNEIFFEGREIPIRIGLYVLCRGSLYIAKRIMDKCLPEDMVRTYLPAHGTEAVVDTLKFMEFEPSDFDKTVVHSWIEFDGNMYIQQNSAAAVMHTVDYLRDFSGADSVHAVYFNHWRTSENRLPISYSAAATESGISLDDYLTLAAERFGFDTVQLKKTVAAAGELDTYCRDNLFNIGFCFLDCWTMHKGIGWTDNWQVESLAAASAESRRLSGEFLRCITDTTTEDGRAYAELCANRYLSTVHHLGLIGEILKIRDICGKNNEGLTEEQKDGVRGAIAGAAVHFEKYIGEYTLMMPDRGCEGLIVDYYKTMRGYFAHLRKYYLGESEEDMIADNGDYAPPPPDSSSAKESSADKNL